jgi:hypothetical protein
LAGLIAARSDYPCYFGDAPLGGARWLEPAGGLVSPKNGAVPPSPAPFPASMLHPNDEAKIEAVARLLRSGLALEGRDDAINVVATAAFAGLGRLGVPDVLPDVIRRALLELGVSYEEMCRYERRLSSALAGAG